MVRAEAINPTAQLGDRSQGKPIVNQQLFFEHENLDVTKTVRNQHCAEVLANLIAIANRHAVHHHDKRCSPSLGLREESRRHRVGIAGCSGDEDPQISRVQKLGCQLPILRRDRVDVG